ncbi:uncharacterized protein F4812DRAFT_456051 [Daldinia caldariorum]|uniref:uncharacterized protein n=1 Tax=Daldinia caldariorum TaxID=326644 RepID=UPI002007C4EA|nr:uncharacterized protein F4812DRAFT_456051 [Daldinia caldariorum]KAI1471948.1 hypothetical protein F4812DRAFT_456051 [Daldinia caldariorum]
MADDIRQVLQKTIDTFLANNDLGVKNKDPSLFSAVLTEDCVRTYRPTSFVERYARFFKPRLTNADYEAQMRVELLTMEAVSHTATRTTIDTARRQATLWTEQTVSTTDGAVTKIELIFDLSFSEDGTRVSQILVFVDTYEASKILEKMLAEAGGAGGAH